MGSVKKSIKKSRKKYLKRNKTKGKTREYRRTKNKRQRNKKSKNKRLTKRNKRYSQKSRKKFIRKKKIYQEGGVDIDFGTLTPGQVGILTYEESIRDDIEGNANKDKICRITGCRSLNHVLPKMLMIDRHAREMSADLWGMTKIAPLAEHVTYKMAGSEKQERKRAEYKPVSELCYWMIKVAEKGATSGDFSPQFNPSGVEEGSICRVKNYGSLNIKSVGELVQIFHGLLDLILAALQWYKNDYEPLLESDKLHKKELIEAKEFNDGYSILAESLPYLDPDISASLTAISDASRDSLLAQLGTLPKEQLAAAREQAQGQKRQELLTLKGELRSSLIESKIPSSDFAIGEYMKLCARLRFFDVTGQDDDKPMLDFMIERIPKLKVILDAKFFEGMVVEVQRKKTTEAAAAGEGWLSALQGWGKKAAPAAGPGEIETTEANPIETG